MDYAPKFINSEFVVLEIGNWHLKPGAPKEIRDEFMEYMKMHEELEDAGIDS